MRAIRHSAAALLAVAFLGASPLSFGAGGSGGHMLHANNELKNKSSLQRGARNYMNYCVGCHSLKYVRYSRLAADLELSEDQLRDNLIFGVDKANANVNTAMTDDQARKWFNAVPPDLSLSGRSRGADWIYTYLKSFYMDDSRTFGVNNLLLSGSSMPNVLWELQGQQQAVYHEKSVTDDNGETSTIEVFDHFELTKPGTMSEAEFDGFVRDTVNFLDYVGEPMKLKRQSLGMMVLGYLAVLGLLAYLLKREYWKDVH